MNRRLPGPGIGLAVPLTIGTILVLASHAGQETAVAIAVVAGASLGLASVLQANDDVLSRTAASVLFVFASVAVAVAVTWAIRTVTHGIGAVGTAAPIVALSWQSILLVVAGTFATFGAVTLPFRRASTEAIRSLLASATVATLVVGVFLAAFARADSLGTIGEFWGRQIGATVDIVLTPGDPDTAPGGTLLVAALAVLGTTALARRLPEQPLSPNRLDERLRHRVVAATPWLRGGGIAIGVAGAVLLALPHSTWSGPLPGAVEGLLVGVAGSSAARRAALAAAVISLAGALLLSVFERVRETYLPDPARLAAQCLGGVVIVGLLLAVGPETIVDRLAAEIPRDGAEIVEKTVAQTSARIFVVGVVFAASAGLVLLLAGIAALGRGKLLPERTASAVVAGCGLGIAALAAGMISGPSLLSIGAVAVGILVWELGTYELSLVEEVGYAAPTRRAELVHVGSLAPIAVAVVGVVLAGSFLFQRASPTSSGAVAALVAAILLGTVVRS